MKKTRIIFLKGKKTILRPLDKEKDLDQLLVWINNPDIRNLVFTFLPFTKKQEEEWIDKQASDQVALAIETKNGKFIGTMNLSKIDYLHGTVTTGSMIGEKRYWGKGYGTDAKMILLNYAFNALNLRKIHSDTFAFNKRSISYSKKCGYKIEGILKDELFINGKYVDVVCLAVFKKDWLNIWQKYNS